jgi:hypothetical protein
MALTLTSDHGYLVLSTASMCFFGAAAGGLYVGATRSKVFGKEWSEGKASEALREEHKKEVGTDFPKQGYVRTFEHGAIWDLGLI